LNWWLPNKRKQEVPAFFFFGYIYIDKKETQNQKCWNPGFFEIFNSQRFDQNLRKITRFSCIVQAGSQKYGRMFKFSYFHIWLIAKFG
jgi:hypothetical protein